MTQTSNIVVQILTEFKGQQNIQKAEQNFLSLGNTIKKLAAGITIEQIAQKSIDAMKAEQVAVTTLSNSLSNLGLSYSSIQPVVEKQAQSFTNLGFMTSDTVESLAKLTTALGNPAKAMDIMATVADLARYKNLSLADTADLVAKAVAGNSRAFADLGLKVDKSLTPQNAFNKLLDQAKAKVGGLAKAYSTTAAGALDVLSAKTDNASAKLGKALAPTITRLADIAIKYLIPALDFLVKHIDPLLAVAAALYSVSLGMKAVGIAASIMAGELAINPIFAAVAAVALLAVAIGKLPGTDTSSKSLAGSSVSGTAINGSSFDPLHATLTPGSGLTTASQTAAAKKKQAQIDSTKSAEQTLAALEKKWAADSLAAQNAANKASATQVQLQKDALALKQQGKVLDLQQIEIFAALQNNISQDDKNRLMLQQALLDQNVTSANKLSASVLAANGLVMDLQGNISKDPFAAWQQSLANWLADLESGLTTIQDIQGVVGSAPSVPMTGNATLDSLATQALAADSAANAAAADAQAFLNSSSSSAPVIVNMTVQGSVTTSSDLVSMVNDGIVQGTAQGLLNKLNRINTGAIA